MFRATVPDLAERRLLLLPQPFPGSRVGGESMIVVPVLLHTGVLLRLQFHFLFTQQLAAFPDHPTLMSASYNLYHACDMALWPAIVTMSA